MANAIGYEELLVRHTAVTPTSSIVGGGVACAVFYVDPKAKFGVRWKPVGTTGASTGLPLGPGKWISVAGEGTIRNSAFVLDASASAEYVRVYVIYFDRVDVVAADFVNDGSSVSLINVEKSLQKVEETLSELLIEAQKQTLGLTLGLEHEL